VIGNQNTRFNVLKKAMKRGTRVFLVYGDRDQEYEVSRVYSNKKLTLRDPFVDEEEDESETNEFYFVGKSQCQSSYDNSDECKEGEYGNQLCLYATRNIWQGEEILWDYGDPYWGEDNNNNNNNDNNLPNLNLSKVNIYNSHRLKTQELQRLRNIMETQSIQL